MIVDLAMTQMTQYTDGDVSNSQLVLASDQIIADVQWIETVEHIVESCEKGASIIKPEVLCTVTKEEEKVKEVCKIVADWTNHTSAEALYCYDQNLEDYSKGLNDSDLKELIAYRPGKCRVFQTSDELNDWIQSNQRIQESLENQTLAASYLARLKKYQILEQIFSNPEIAGQLKEFQKDRKIRLKWEYLLMKFAIENHSLGFNILRFVELPWCKYSSCKEFRNFIASNGLEFPLADKSQLIVKEPILDKGLKNLVDEGQEPPKDFTCTQDFRSALTDRDLRTLDKGKWLNDQIISHYGAHLMSASSRSDIYFIHSTVFVLGAETRTVPVKNDFKTFVISVNLKNQHWALVLVCLEQQRIFYADSWPYNRKHHFFQDKNHLKKNGDVKAKFQSVLSKVEDKQQSIRQQVVSVLKGNGYDIEKFNWVESVMPMQDNGCDCGIYVLKYFEDFLENELELLDAWGKGKDMRKRYGGFSASTYRAHIKSKLQ